MMKCIFFTLCDRPSKSNYLIVSLSGKCAAFQIRLARGRSRNSVECVPRIPKRYAEEGMVSRELLTPSKPRVRLGGKATARGAGGTCEFAEGELRNEYEATQKGLPRGTLRESRGAAEGSNIRHGEWIHNATTLFYYSSYYSRIRYRRTLQI